MLEKLHTIAAKLLCGFLQHARKHLRHEIIREYAAQPPRIFHAREHGKQCRTDALRQRVHQIHLFFRVREKRSK